MRRNHQLKTMQAVLLVLQLNHTVLIPIQIHHQTTIVIKIQRKVIKAVIRIIIQLNLRIKKKHFSLKGKQKMLIGESNMT